MPDIPFPTLHTDRLILRRLSETDSDVIMFLRSDNEVNRYIERQKTRNHEEALAFINKTQKLFVEKRMLYWGINLKKRSELIGTICLWNFSKDRTIAEMGYELDPSFQNQGIMSEAMKRVIDFGFNNLQLSKIEAFTHRENIPSNKLLKKHNFKHEAGRIDGDNLNNIILVRENNLD